MKTLNSLFILAILLSWISIYAGLPIKAARSYLYILIHGEDGKKSGKTHRVFTSGSVTGGLKAYLEGRYDLKGFVYAFQMPDPSAALDTWTREFGDPDNSNSWLNRARNQHKEFLKHSRQVLL